MPIEVRHYNITLGTNLNLASLFIFAVLQDNTSIAFVLKSTVHQLHLRYLLFKESTVSQPTIIYHHEYLTRKDTQPANVQLAREMSQYMAAVDQFGENDYTGVFS